MAEHNDSWINDSCHKANRVNRYICGPVSKTKEITDMLRRKNKKLREKI